jgi:uncharacterized protein (DUF2062 family)
MRRRTLDQDRLASYWTEVTSALVACGVVAGTVGAYVAAAAILLAVEGITLVTGALLRASNRSLR